MDVTTIMQYATPILTLVGGWLSGRRKGKAEAEKVEGNALSIMQDTYTQLVTDMKERYISLQQEIDSLQLLNRKLTNSIGLLRKEVKLLKKDNETIITNK
tara:strand:- start:674 stop:973 length:300 start_codon:yes stop_codon:yes gene_type:complete